MIKVGQVRLTESVIVRDSPGNAVSGCPDPPLLHPASGLWVAEKVCGQAILCLCPGSKKGFSHVVHCSRCRPPMTALTHGSGRFCLWPSDLYNSRASRIAGRCDATVQGCFSVISSSCGGSLLEPTCTCLTLPTNLPDVLDRIR